MKLHRKQLIPGMPEIVNTPSYANAWRAFKLLCLVIMPLMVSKPVLAEQVELSRLFYTPAQRAQLESARTRNVTRLAPPSVPNQPAPPPAPTRFDGIVIRSDGQSTRWVDGKAEVGTSSVKGLKPGQIRANGKVYEPYQVLRPQPAISEPTVKERAP